MYSKPTDGGGDREPPGDRGLALAMARLSDGFASLDREWRYTYVNDTAVRLVGKSREELLGQNVWTLFPDAVGRPFHVAALRAMATQEVTLVRDYQPSHKRWYESRLYPSQDGVSVFFVDITDRRRIEGLLAGQAQVLESLAHGAPLAGALGELLRMVERQCEGMRCSILLLDPDGVSLRHGSAPSLPEGFTVPLDGTQIGPTVGSCGAAAFLREPVITEDIATDASWRPWRELALSHGLRACWSSPIFDDKRRVLGTFAMYRDVPIKPNAHDQSVVELATHIAAIAITRDRAETARRRSESRYRRLVDSNVIGVVIADDHGKIREANDEFLRIIGYPRIALEAGDLSWELLARAELVDLSVREGEFFHARGHRIWLRTTSARVEDGEGETIWLVEDMTDRKEQERIRQKYRELEQSNRAALAASQLKSEFLANMSHELRTPLNAILGFSEFLLDEHGGPITDKQSECLQHVLVSGRHLLRLVSDVLDLAKVEAGKLDLLPDEFSMAEVLEEVCSVARALARDKQISLQLRCDPKLDRVTLDPQKFKQILFNLLANAVKFTDPGGSIDVDARAVNEQELEVSVRDSGIGIRQEDISKLFREFQQLDSGASRRHEGTGLGLALAKRLVESQRGRMGVESQLGQGSTFYVTLPRKLRSDRV
jgi:PAS domain S-box-containing protein